MLTRICRAAAVATACLLVAVGGVVLAVVSPAALVGVIMMGSIVGLVVATHLPGSEAPGELSAPWRTRPLHAAGVGAAAAAITASALLALAGSAAVLGAAAGPVFLLLFLGAGAGLWRHRAAWRAYATALVRIATPPAGSAADTSGGAARLPVLAPPFLPGTLTLQALCVAWQRSDRSLHGLPAGPARSRLIATRERLLDELERRDPVGFRHWLYRGVHASSDPGRHLTENRPGSARTSRRNDSPAP
jgi:hypothetical protein